MGELAGWNRATVLHYYDDVWKLQRRYLHQVLGTRAGLRKYDDLRKGAAARFVKGLIDSPGSLEEQCHMWASFIHSRTHPACIRQLIFHSFTYFPSAW